MKCFRICTAYIYSVLVLLHLNSNPTASILKSIEVKDTLAPYVPSFSSRGPNNIAHDLLKVAYAIILDFLLIYSMTFSSLYHVNPIQHFHLPFEKT